MASSNQEKIKELLGSGLSNEVVASTIGVHPSYISQLMSEETFYNEVIELRTKNLAAATVRDRSIDSIEDMLLSRLTDYVDNGTIYKPQDILRTFQVINSAKRRGTAPHHGQVINNTVVNLTLPSKVMNKFVTNTTGEVVEVEGKTLVTMPASKLLSNLIAEKSANDPDAARKYKQVQKYLPQTIEASPEAVSVLEDNQQGNPVDVRQIPQRPRGPDLSKIYARQHREGTR